MKAEVIQRSVWEAPVTVRWNRKALLIKIGLPKVRWRELINQTPMVLAAVLEALFVKRPLQRKVGPGLPNETVEAGWSRVEPPRFF